MEKQGLITFYINGWDNKKQTEFTFYVDFEENVIGMIERGRPSPFTWYLNDLMQTLSRAKFNEKSDGYFYMLLGDYEQKVPISVLKEEIEMAKRKLV